MLGTQGTRYLYIFLMFSFGSFPQVISTTGEEFSTMKNQDASLGEELVGFIRYFNSNLHLDILEQ